MSSSSTVASNDNVVALGRKLYVHVAENGHSLEFECDGSTPVEAIQRSIETHFGVPLGDQLLLCRNTTLDSQQNLSYYKLPQDDREVFLYNKARLHADSPRPLPEVIDVPEPVLPAPPSPAQESHPLDKAPDPALKALISYERQFRYHFQLANGIYSCSQAKFEICKRLLREQQVQERAMDTARGNLELTYRKLQQRYNDFVRCFSMQHKVHSDLLTHFERDVERLRVLKLYPNLQSETRKCLLDLVKVDDMRKWEDVCFNSHRQFEVKVLQLKANFEELKRRTESLFSLMGSTSCRDLEIIIRDHQKVLNDQKSVMQSLSKDVNTAKRLVDETDSQQSASLRPHDAVSALGRMYDVHEKSLRNVHSCDHDMSKLLDKCKSRKNDLTVIVHISMQKVKSVQIGIKDTMHELHAFQEVMGHQEREFENLKLVNGIGHAYRACLAEIVRRKSSLKLYMGLAGQLAERLATERENEIRKREEFYKRWSKFMPHDILISMGLFDSPSQCDVNITPFDRNLLDIDLVDVDRYAPQSLVGLLSKPERTISTKGSMGLSGSDSVSISGQSSIHAGEKMESQELLGVYDSVDIAGTSKLEVENAQLKAELASAFAIICTFRAEREIGYDSVDEGAADNMLKSIKEKTAEALQLKDEYAKHLGSMLNAKQEQCLSYEKRIQELEQRLSDHYLQGQKLAAVRNSSHSSLSAIKSDSGKLDIFGDGEEQMAYLSTMPMDEISSTSALVDSKLDQIIGLEGKPAEGGDENMTDLSGTVNTQSAGFTRNSMDASMHETPQDENEVDQIGSEGKDVVPQLITTNNSENVSSDVPQDMHPRETVTEPALELKISNSHIEDLERTLAVKSKQYDEIENKLKATVDEVTSLRRELEINRNLLDESQMNCAHLENCLHEAREEARTNLCAADRRASEYNALRTSAIKMRGLFERLRGCVTSSSGVAGFADSLRSLALSLASSVNEDEDAGTKEFQACVKVLADKVTFLSRHRAELLDRCSKFEAANGTLSRELDEKKERINKLYTKLQASIAFYHFELRDRAAFVLNSAGHYEAINRNCSNYYLSEESIALFKEQNSSRPPSIIGQIVHIEQHMVTPSTSMRTEHGDQIETSNYEVGSRRAPGLGASWNPYNLPIGCEYFIVTVAMLPDTIH